MPPQIEVDEVTHPVLGPLKFPKTMPYAERNQLIDELLVKQRIGPVASHIPGNRREAMEMLASHKPTMEPPPFEAEATTFGAGRPLPPTRHDIAEAMPAVGATVAGLAASELGPLAIPIAGLGGAAGEVVKRGIEPPTTRQSRAQEAKDIALEGGKQALYEAGGRVLAAGAGRVIGSRAATEVGEQVGKRVVPETTGQAYGKTGGFTQTIEHYLSKTFLGGPLKRVQAAQEAASREILADLSKVSEADTSKLAVNWERARETARVAAQPMYQEIGKGPVPSNVSEVTKELLNDSELRLSSRAQGSLSKVSGRLAVKGVDAGATMSDAMLARSEIGQLASRAGNSRDRMLLWEAYERLDHAIEEGLTPEEIAIKKQADTLWRQSYIMARMARGFQRMERIQSPEEAQRLLVNRFVGMVNDLGRGELTHDPTGTIVRKASDLEVLFPDPADRKAMADLANFMSTKYSTLGGAAGISESIARIGVALEALEIPAMAATGHLGVATRGAAGLAGMAGLSHILARPGGAKLAYEYFKSPGAEAAAALLRASGLVTSQPKNRREALDLLRGSYPAAVPP